MLNERCESFRAIRKMIRARATFPVLICALCLPLCWAGCPPEIGQPLDLSQFSGTWFLVAGTPGNGKSSSKCGRFEVENTSLDTFTIKYTAVSRKYNAPVSFKIAGNVGDNIIGNWQLEGSKKVLGPFKHTIISVDYSSDLAMLVCSENNSTSLPGYKFSMIWSRRRSLPLPILEKLKSKLGAYINQGEILMADHRNC